MGPTERDAVDDETPVDVEPDADLRVEEELRIRRALRASELSYRRLFEAAQDGILILDVHTGRIDDVNPYLLRLLGYVRADMVGKTVAELSPFKDIESNEAMLARLQANGYARYEHLPLETSDGRHIDVEFVSNVYDAGEDRVIQCNIRDITERKRRQVEVQRLNEELERRVVARTAELLAANQELEAFSYSVSHDLRAPLRHVVGFVELLRTELGPTAGAKSVRHLDTIARSARRMGTLIDDLLSFSRVGRAELVSVDVDLAQLVREARSELEPETAGRDIAWTVHPLPHVQGDRALLRLVLVNLLSNAVKFTSRRPTARIEVGCTSPRTGQTVLFVRDDGAGFDPRYVDKLFGVFQRLHGQHEFEGTGIGLANVRRIVERHGGRTWAEGALDAGATFYVSIPTAGGSDHVA